MGFEPALPLINPRWSRTSVRIELGDLTLVLHGISMVVTADPPRSLSMHLVIDDALTTYKLE
jgi:hypothetical protein